MPSTLTFSATANDLWATQNESEYYDTTATLFLCHSNASGDAWRAHDWIPFTLLLPRRQIISATLKFYATQDRSDTILCNVGCEDADNPSKPADAADLKSRVMTTARVSNYSPAAFTAGTQYSITLTTAVQEVLDRAGWAYGNTLAVLFNGLSTGANDARRLIASVENATYTEPRLEIVVDDYVPQAMGII